MSGLASRLHTTRTIDRGSATPTLSSWPTKWTDARGYGWSRGREKIRTNTTLKSEAAVLWCDKMSRTAYGSRRYLFVPQRKLEAALATGVKTLAELADSLVVPRPRPQLRLFPLDDEWVQREAFKTLLPLYSLKAAVGRFGDGEDLEPGAWIETDGLAHIDERMFVCRAIGRSREPTIRDDDYLVFRTKPVRTRPGTIVLAQYRGPTDPDTGGGLTIRHYFLQNGPAENGERSQTRILLSPVNSSYQPIHIPKAEGEHFRIVVEFVAVLRAS